MHISRTVRFRDGVLALALTVVMATAALAQPAPTSNYTSFDATPGRPVQLGYYASTHKDRTPAQVVFYQARAGAIGIDHPVYEVTNPNGDVATYDVTIKIKSLPEQLKPPNGSRI